MQASFQRSLLKSLDRLFNSRILAFEFVIQILLRKKKNCEYLSVLGNAVRTRYIPKGGLKKLFLRHPDHFLLNERKDGTCIVQIVDPASFTLDPGILTDYIDFDALERNIALFMLSREGKTDEPLSLPLLGEYCKFVLGIDMKHKLFKFVSDRNYLFTMPDNGRQQVFLVPGACEKLGIQGQVMLPKFPETIPEFHDPTIVMDATSLRDLDQIALEIHEMITKAGGMLPIAEIEQEMKTTKAAVINAAGMDEKEWHLGSITYKYPHIFRRINQNLALVDSMKPVYNPDSRKSRRPNHQQCKSTCNQNSAESPVDDFPPL